MKARVKETGAIFQVLGVVSNTADGYALDEVDLYCDESDNLVVGVSEDEASSCDKYLLLLCCR